MVRVLIAHQSFLPCRRDFLLSGPMVRVLIAPLISRCTAEVSRAAPNTRVLAPSRPVDLVSGFSHSASTDVMAVVSLHPEITFPRKRRPTSPETGSRMGGYPAAPRSSFALGQLLGRPDDLFGRLNGSMPANRLVVLEGGVLGPILIRVVAALNCATAAAPWRLSSPTANGRHVARSHCRQSNIRDAAFQQGRHSFRGRQIVPHGHRHSISPKTRSRLTPPSGKIFIRM
jgi:hypothetical protein